MDQQLLKITYHSACKTMSSYLKMPRPLMLEILKTNVELYLFDERMQPRCEIRFYWIDNDGDEIDIINQDDFKIFLNKRGDSQHLHVTPVNDGPVAPEKPNNPQHEEETSRKSATQSQIPPAADELNENRIHSNVECDACLMVPIVGFRYKCIQCPNYDLCQNCEAKHVHADHMMVRMPNNSCPYIIDAVVTDGRKWSRKHEKRCKSGESTRLPCGFAYASAGGNDKTSNKEGKANAGEQADATGKDRLHHGRRHRRQVRHNFLSHLYEMMNDFADGGGEAATAAAMGTADGCGGTNDNTATTSGMAGAKDADIISHTASAYAAAENAHKVAAQTAEIAANVAQQTSMATAAAAAASAANSVNTGAKSTTEPTIEKDGPTTSNYTQPPTTPGVPVFPSPSLENLAQFLNPTYMKTGIEILNNFSDMFAKMLDPVDGAQAGDSPSTSTSCPFESIMRTSATASTKSTDSKKSQEEPKQQNEGQQTTKDAEKNNKENKNTMSNNSLIDIMDLGSDSESDGVTDDFVKLNVPTKENTPEKAAADTSTSSSTTASPTSSNENTPPQSLNKSNVMDFAQLSADLKAHIAQEQQKNASTPEKENATPAATAPVVEMRAVPVFKTTPTKPSDAAASTNAEPKKPEERRYHADERINSSVRAMMAMGFANEGAMLTQLLESVNGNISAAVDIILATQR